MKNYLLLFFIFVVPSIAMSQNPNCSKFKNGTFKITSPVAEYIIIRTDSIQTEEDFKTGLKTEFRVKWISDCSYTLEPIRHIRNPEDQKFPHGMIITVTILVTKKNSYLMEASSNMFEGKIKGEVFKIKQ